MVQPWQYVGRWCVGDGSWSSRAPQHLIRAQDSRAGATLKSSHAFQHVPAGLPSAFPSAGEVSHISDSCTHTQTIREKDGYSAAWGGGDGGMKKRGGEAVEVLDVILAIFCAIAG